ncbi:HNH endonuclease [Saccharococcus sp. Marseille-Q5394]|uniref:HNH endonuclease n=1 Tax=Saccharococcus sp. Marseille-Q5394 TaxID=2972778 RepID=UPI0021C8E986|nr:HNH endonuclease signature motif containing protein [Saccharococcus sp. Marseille-Q5394]
MGVSIGDSCTLYKRCKICEEYKHKMSFPSLGGKGRSAGKRRSFCYDCKERRHERIIEPVKEYSYDTSILDANGEITIRGRTKNNRKYESVISYEKAKRIVEEGSAGIYHSTLIHHFYNRRTIKAFILERDDYSCHYCGKYGDTLDHKIPKAKGGLTTIANCVCACSKCNTKKSDMEYDEYMEKIHGIMS